MIDNQNQANNGTCSDSFDTENKTESCSMTTLHQSPRNKLSQKAKTPHTIKANFNIENKSLIAIPASDADLATKPDDDIKRKSYFYLLVLNYGILSSNMGYNSTVMGPILPTIANKDNFAIPTDQESLYFSYLSSAFLLGIFISNITIGLFRNSSPRTVLNVMIIFNMLSLLLIFIDNIEVLILTRFLVGYIAGYMQVTGSAVLYDLSPPKLRVYCQMIYSLHFAVGSTLSYICGLFEDGGSERWKINLMVPGIQGLLHLALQITLYEHIDSPLHLLRLGSENKARLCVESYMNKNVANEIVNSFKAIIAYENKLGDNAKSSGKSKTKTKTSTVSLVENGPGLLQFFRQYLRETLFGMYLGFATTASFNVALMAYNSILFIEDPNDKNETAYLTELLPFFTLAEVIATTTASVFNFHKKRKVANLIGMYGYSLGWFLLALAYFLGNFVFVKYLGFLFFVLKGAFLIPSFFIYINDCLVAEIMGLACSSMYLTGFIVTFITPFMIKDRANFMYFAFGVGIFNLIISIISSFVLFETDGLEKHEIFMKFRNPKILLQTKPTKSFVNSVHEIKENLLKVSQDIKESLQQPKNKIGANTLPNINIITVPNSKHKLHRHNEETKLKKNVAFSMNMMEAPEKNSVISILCVFFDKKQKRDCELNNVKSLKNLDNLEVVMSQISMKVFQSLLEAMAEEEHISNQSQTFSPGQCFYFQDKILFFFDSEFFSNRVNPIHNIHIIMFY